MLLKVNLVVIVLIGTIGMARALKDLQICTRSYTDKSNEFDTSISNGEDLVDKMLVRIQKARFARNSDNRNESLNATTLPDELKNERIERQILYEAEKIFDDDNFQESARGRHKMDRMLMALLVAYKMKFMALIPTLIGSIMLLLASNALVGFFFALFASVVSMKGR